MLEVIDQSHPQRLETEQAIRDVYWREHAARLEGFPKRIVRRVDDQGVVCAASLRFAEDGFFSECYLDQPIESVIGLCVGSTPRRESLVEVGALAASRPGEIMSFIHDIIELSKSQGAEWSFFTATARLRALLRRGGIPLIEVAVADARRVGNPHLWGAYYRQDPRVMLVGAHMIAPSWRHGAPHSPGRCKATSHA